MLLFAALAALQQIGVNCQTTRAAALSFAQPLRALFVHNLFSNWSELL